MFLRVLSDSFGGTPSEFFRVSDSFLTVSKPMKFIELVMMRFTGSIWDI